MELVGKLLERDARRYSDNVLCEACQGENKRTNASGACQDCKEYMCNTCFRHHLKAKQCRNHVFVNINERSALALKGNEEDVEKCKKHDNEVVKFYCRVHDVVGCGDCIIMEHVTCKPEYIRDLAKTFQKEDKFKQLYEKLDLIESYKKKIEEKLEKNKKEINSLNMKALRDIRQYRSDTNKYFDKAEAELLTEVEKLTSENNVQHRKLEQQVRLLVTNIEEVKQKLNTGNLSNVSFIHAVTCQPKMETIEKTYQQIRQENALKKFEFVHGEKISEILKAVRHFGRLRCGDFETNMACYMNRKKWFESFLKSDETTTTKIDLTAYTNEMHKKGVAGSQEKLSEDLDKWTNIEHHVAVTGNSGTGKASFINTFRGLRASDPGAARVGLCESAIACSSYRHPENRNFIIWELPGVGTPQFLKQTYLEKVRYDKYDFVVIVFKRRLTENEVWIALELQKRNKKLFFVRSNIDIDIMDHKIDYPETHDEKNLIDSIRKEVESSLRNQGVRDPKVFLINNRAKDKYDFGRLTNELLASCYGLKKDSMALSLSRATKEVMAEKKRILNGRICGTAMAIACCKCECEKKKRFQEEIKFYQKKFNIDDVSVEENTDLLSLSKESIQEFKLVFDEISSRKEMQVTTPLAKKQHADNWEYFMDMFVFSKQNTLLYKYCEMSLKYNLHTLYEKACNLYDVKTTTQTVNTFAQW